MRRLPQGLKPGILAPFAERLKSCPSLSGFVSLLLLLVVGLPAQQGRIAGQAQASIGAAPVRVEPPRPNYLFPDGRSYVYAAEWHLITAGTGGEDGHRRKRTQGHRDRRIFGRRQRYLSGSRSLRIALRSAYVLLALDLQAQ